MNESSIFCSRYLSEIETQFSRDERNDDSVPEDKVVGQLEVFVKMVQPLGARVHNLYHKQRNTRYISTILNNVDEITQYCKYRL